jgi:hypothetical protein
MVVHRGRMVGHTRSSVSRRWHSLNMAEGSFWSWSIELRSFFTQKDAAQSSWDAKRAYVRYRTENRVHCGPISIRGAMGMAGQPKKILLIDLDDPRRETRVHLLQQAGHSVDVRRDYVAAESLSDEGTYDLIIIAIHLNPENVIQYSDNLAKAIPNLPVLLLLDSGVFVPRDTLARHMETGHPIELMKAVASMLVGSTHIRELPA